MAAHETTLNVDKIQKALDKLAEDLKKAGATENVLTERAARLGKSFEQAQAAKKVFDDGLKQSQTAFQNFGESLGLAGDFATKQADALKKQNEKALKASLRDFQSETGLPDDVMNSRYKELGGSGEAFGWKPELVDRLEERKDSFSASADENFQDFLDKTVPKRLGEASDAFANLFMGIAQGTKHSSDLFADLGQSVLQTAQGIATDLMQVGLRFALFGSKENGFGGFFGTLISGIGGWLGGGAQPQAHGGTFAAGSGLAAYSNSIVSRPTYFPFAHGIGLMGEAGAEAIMPLARMASGDLGVQVQGGGCGMSVVNNFEQSFAISVDGANKGGERISEEIAKSIGNQMQRQINALVDQRLITQARPGGLLNQGIH